MKQIYKSKKTLFISVLLALCILLSWGEKYSVRAEESESGRVIKGTDIGRAENVVAINKDTLRLYYYPDLTAGDDYYIAELYDEELEHSVQDADEIEYTDITDANIGKHIIESDIGTNIYIILDNSSSAEKIKDSLVEQCGFLGTNDSIYLFMATDSSETLAQSIGKYNSDNSSDLLNDLEEVCKTSSNESANVYAALCQVADEMKYDNSSYRNISILISDTEAKDSQNLDNVYSSIKNHNLPVYYLSPDNSTDGFEDYKLLAENSGGEIIGVDDIYSELIEGFFYRDFNLGNNALEKTNTYTIDFKNKHRTATIATITCTDETQLTDDNNKIMESVKKNINPADSADSSSSSDSDQNSDKSKDSGKLSDATNSTASDASENDASPSEPEGKNDNGSSLKKILLIAIIAVIAILAVVIVIFVILSRKKKNNPVNGTQNPGVPGGNVNPAVNAVNQNVQMGSNVQMGGGNVYPPNTQMRNSSNNSVSVKPAPQYGLPIMLEIRIKGTVLQQIQTKINGSIIIGRSNICDVMIDNTTVSRQHFAMEYDGESIYIQDLNTKNGTYLNGVKLTHKRRIEKEDKIRVGSLEIIVRW